MKRTYQYDTLQPLPVLPSGPVTVFEWVSASLFRQHTQEGTLLEFLPLPLVFGTVNSWLLRLYNTTQELIPSSQEGPTTRVP